MKYDNLSLIWWNDWNKLDNFINPSSLIYGHIDLMRHISFLRAATKQKVLTLKWSV